MSTPRVLVTGGSSRLGSVVVPQLVQTFGSVLAATRSPAAARTVRELGADPFQLDLDDPQDPGVDADLVIHLAGINFAPAVAELVTWSHATGLIATSSASAVVQGNPNREWILAAEQQLQELLPNSSILRPTMIYGSSQDHNVSKIYRSAVKMRRVPRITGGCRLMPVLADDLSSAIIELASEGAPRCIRPVGGPEPVTLGMILDAVCEAADVGRLPVSIPLGPMIKAARLLGHRESRLIHAVQMLGVSREVLPPGEVGFRYQPTSLSDGMVLSVARYQKAAE
jgi:nucleoside-diphosphate-sugar epimerase